MGDDLERRWERVWYGLLLVALVVPSIGLLGRGEEPAGERLLTAGLAVALGAWHVLLMLRRPADTRRSLPITGWWVITLALLSALIAREGAYAIVVFALYPLAFVTLDWWAIPVVAVINTVALVVLGQQNGAEVAYSVGASTAIAIAIGLLVSALARQREELAEALTANRRLQGLLVERARSAGVLEERTRLAREIHDTVAQGLTSIVTQLEVADQRLESGDRAGAARRVDLVRAIARESLGEVRRAVADLRPELLDGGSLVEALERLVTRTREETGLDVRLELSGRFCDLPPGVDTTLLRCGQEALANVRRHSGAGSVQVILHRGAGTAELIVTDDGGGFDPANGNGGAGLVGMAERAAAADGSLDVRSAPGAGTTVSVRVPA